MDEEQTQEPQIAEETGNLYDDSMGAVNGNPNKVEIFHIAEQFTRNLEGLSEAPTSEYPPSSPVKKSPDSLSSAFQMYQRLRESEQKEPENPDGVSLQRPPGTIVATLRDTSDPRPEPGKPGVPFGPVCTADGTFVTGDVTFEGNTPSLKAVDNAARTAFGSAASFDPRRGPDMDRIEETMKTIGEEPAVSVQAIQNDPRCAP